MRPQWWLPFAHKLGQAAAAGALRQRKLSVDHGAHLLPRCVVGHAGVVQLELCVHCLSEWPHIIYDRAHRFELAVRSFQIYLDLVPTAVETALVVLYARFQREIAAFANRCRQQVELTLEFETATLQVRIDPLPLNGVAPYLLFATHLPHAPLDVSLAADSDHAAAVQDPVSVCPPRLSQEWPILELVHLAILCSPLQSAVKVDCSRVVAARPVRLGQQLLGLLPMHGMLDGSERRRTARRTGRLPWRCRHVPCQRARVASVRREEGARVLNFAGFVDARRVGTLVLCLTVSASCRSRAA
eukprot:scaffold120091_cov70-Phaeocystis_antarctica.AAC.3